MFRCFMLLVLHAGRITAYYKGARVMHCIHTVPCFGHTKKGHRIIIKMVGLISFVVVVD